MTRAAVKKVAAKIQRKVMQMLAKAQNEAKAGKADELEMAKATKSVNDVTVMEAPARANPDAARLAKVSWSSAVRATLRS